MSAFTRLKSAIGNMVQVMPVREGLVPSDRIALDRVEVEPFHTAFRRMVRTLEFDLSEMPIATLGQAISAGVSITALPIPASSRMHHTSILCRTDSDIAGPQDLIGRRVAGRSWPQTSGIWIRGILQHEYGIDLGDIHWIVQEGPHVPEFTDPDYVKREVGEKSLLNLLMSGSVDAITGLHGVPEGTRPVIADADLAAAAWFDRTGIFPVNHVICLRNQVLAGEPGLAAAVTEYFDRAFDIARTRGDLDSARLGLSPGIDLYQTGLDHNRRSMQMLLDYSIEQNILPRATSLDRLFPER